MNGTVKMYNADRGFGFLKPEGGGDDVFVHVSELQRNGIDDLQEGDKVTFETKMDPKRGKSNAVDVRRA